MQIILEEQDIQFIEKINKDLEEATEATWPALFINQKKNYSISFDVVDIAKANNFIYEIVMNPLSKRFQEIENKLGVRFTSVNYSEGDAKLNELKQHLKDFLIKLEEF